jgi:ribose transport system ATP-binding protein
VTATTPAPALSIRGLAQTFPGVKALKGVDLRVDQGTVHALLGHNGSGKSTLVKALAGYHVPDEGCESLMAGEPFGLGLASEAKRLGARFVHQDLGLVLELSAQDNVGLVGGYERGASGRIHWKDQARVTREMLTRFGIKLDPRAPLSEASPVERTAVAIVRALAGLSEGSGLLVLDEPTASLPAREVDELFTLVREIRDAGTAVLLISHRLDEVMAIADHATVLRNGLVVWDGSTEGMTVGHFAALIADAEGTEVLEAAPERVTSVQHDVPPAMSIKGVTGRYLQDVSLDLHVGEVLGIAGLLGSGREELPYAVAGAAGPGVTGSFTVGGVTLDRLTISLARRLGVALVPADRGGEGIIAEFSVAENVSIAALPGLRRKIFGRGGNVSRRGERRFVLGWLASVDADVTAAPRRITTLSGGNQQKAVIARWLSVTPKVLAVSEPTAGIDIGARNQIYKELRARAADGLAILVCSSDTEDLVAACDRVLVMRDGHVAAELVGTDISKAAIIAAMEGAHHDDQRR